MTKPTEHHRCLYCRSNSPDDDRGNCGACGAPRGENKRYEWADCKNTDFYSVSGYRIAPDVSISFSSGLSKEMLKKIMLDEWNTQQHL